MSLDLIATTFDSAGIGIDIATVQSNFCGGIAGIV
jgi:hypothetical protein